ncbi:asparagine synthase (glutamine-hydrolyzing) [Riemerella anatipestifer]|uniref:asparagine synthase (glutamine-hydrolyzing) n=1 Tax=Riemerella anatipestifer TaxID=34085 RepID=UPI0020979AF3|nr:asparagine synthase (glutamine-hydrolyzing) [Riemerella anatipestifer]MCO7353179.1 asparagine synthase (glutamine-hydrolyzing) [Riemerella anatipestifer]MCT6767408.1 asparagine synthase (glutamine-hydrolyzing) [Riemerella anatipestifer]
MCGINGLILKDINSDSAIKKLEIMNQRIFHRGPDEDGFFVEQKEQNVIGFAMRRLSIIDLSSGKQPIFSEDGTKVIVFNGEIYNYQSLRKQLLSVGKTFKTNSDTEVILRLYEVYGKEAFKMLDGMFAFSIYDKSINKVFIARDFFGEKPLYYQNSKGGLIWCSELKSLMSVSEEERVISKEGLNLYFQLTYIPAPFTIYEGIYKLEPNHFIEYDLVANEFRLEKIHIEGKFYKRDISFDDAKKELRDLVKESVLSRSISDVPIGTFLSGGVDSSIVTVCLAEEMGQKINTFSIGYDKKSFDESDKSKIVAKQIGSTHHQFILKEQDLEDEITSVLQNFDEPFADSSALPSFFVAKKTSEYVKVALTGDGGDEVFGGYNKYLIGKINERYTQIVPKALHCTIKKVSDFLTKQKEDQRGLKFKVRKAVNAIDYGGEFYYNMVKLGFQEPELSRFLRKEWLVKDALSLYKERIPNPKTLNDFRNVDRMISLEGDMIVKVDRTSMLTSLECRAPFLNKKLWDYSHTLPEHYLLNGNNKKYILKKAFEDKFPEGFLEKSKKGFGVPVGDWLKSTLKEELMSYVVTEKLEKQGLFNVLEIQKLVYNHLNEIEDNTFRVWTLYCFQKWYFNMHLE